jgi:hypothetical protein
MRTKIEKNIRIEGYPEFLNIDKTLLERRIREEKEFKAYIRETFNNYINYLNTLI